MNKKILVIDDEPKIRSFIRISLHAEGFTCVEATTAKEGLQMFNDEKPHLIILDLGLPDQDGYQVLRELRQSSRVPVLVLTARDEEAQKIKLLEGGANDYLSKPFGVKELVARIKVLLRDINYQPTPSMLHFEGISIDTQDQKVTIDGVTTSLTKKEFALLIRLAQAPNQLLTQNQLLSEIWGQSHTEDSHYLRVLITQLRKKLDDDADAPRFIKTEPGIGYRFVCQALTPQSEA
ncbi:response regulator [Pseudoalteromonas xiamenensis]|uniref:Response regulator transcription factor n=1 Tax=Pseudoalteromonas xiamenensis TaxID=882626 RepID=A0A975HK72_9GAMM|nr:response regulator transcription factor [Pseudoalteromonas xiamenensis]QTH70674.1 response regulator transcription factor [Pseudoalteromonas xiamenensis]WMN58955.1 response regulator transcription factor [Pseudoalteromonas xiamenensis]